MELEEPKLKSNRSTSLTLVETAERAERNALSEVQEEDDSQPGYGGDLYDLQRRRRSSMYLRGTLPVKGPLEEPYGWVIVVCVFIIHIIVDGITYSFGAIYTDLLKDYPGGNATLASFIVSILMGVTYGCGPLASYMCDRFGARCVAVLGSVMACAGCLLSTITVELWQLALTYGALTGLGFGFMYLPAMVTVASWFDQRRAIAVSIAVCGSGVGTTIFNPLTTVLLEYYGLRGCMTILAGFCIQGAVFGAMLRPPPREHDADEPELGPSATSMRRGRRQTAVVIRLRRWIKNEVDWNLVTNWTFILYCVSSFLGGLSCYVPYVYNTDRMVKESDTEMQDASNLFILVGLTNILGRLTSGILSDRKIADNVVLYSVSCIASGLATSFSIWCASYLQHAFYDSFFGYTGGVIVALQSVVLTDIVGVERISNAFGILLFVQGAAVFIGPASFGYLVDISTDDHQYRLCYILAGAVMCMSGVLLLLVPLVMWCKKCRRRRPNHHDDRQMVEFSVICESTAV